MNWFKKSIAYDQKRKLLFLPILIILPIIFSIMGSVSRMKVDNMLPRYNGFSIGAGYTSYLAVIGVVSIIAIVSSGIRDKSEVSYMESMPMKVHDVTMTRLSCASITAIVPLAVGFLVSTFVYISNKGLLQKEGYLYLDIVYKYALMTLVALLIIGLVYLASVLYKNIKVPIVLGIGGIISLGYMTLLFAQCFDYSNPLRGRIAYIVNDAIKVFQLPTNDKAVFYPFTLASILVLLGVVVLLFVLIDYVTSSANNDVYDRLFSLKISKAIYYVLSVLIIMFIFGNILELVVQYTYVDPLARNVDYQNEVLNIALNKKLLLVSKIKFGVVVILLPLWIFISKKIGKVLEERF